MNKRRIYIVLSILFFIGFIVSGAMLLRDYNLKQSAEDKFAEMAKKTNKAKKPNKEETTKPPVKEKVDILKERGITIPDKTLDWAAFQKENADIYAWIYIPGTKVDYPVLQHPTELSYYLDYNLDGSKGLPGCIYTQNLNKKDFMDPNTVIYGHNLKVGGEMFSQLKEYEEESFYKEHPNFYIYTPDGKTRTYTVFSAAVVKDTADQYNLTYATDEAFESYLKMCKEDSAYDTGTEVNAQSQIVSLSTCTNVREDERFLLQGVLTATDGGEN